MVVTDAVLSGILAVVFLLAAIPKLRYPRGFELSVLEYRVLPAWPSRVYARMTPLFEFLAALLLVTGTAVSYASALLALLLCSFILAIGINIVRGRDLDCHCFGSSLPRRVSWKSMTIDLLLLLMALIITVSTVPWGVFAPWSLFHLIGSVERGATNTAGVGSIALCVVFTTAIAAFYRLTSARKEG